MIKIKHGKQNLTRAEFYLERGQVKAKVLQGPCLLGVDKHQLTRHWVLLRLARETQHKVLGQARAHAHRDMHTCVSFTYRYKCWYVKKEINTLIVA